MSRILISILSDHVIPNYLFIKEVGDDFDDMIFITTEYAEKHEISLNLETTVGVAPNSVPRICVSNENYASIIQELSEHNFSRDDQYIVNVTGGTKAMSIALFHFFSDYGARFVYIPIGTNQYFDLASTQSHPITYRVSLREYLSLYGMTYEWDKEQLHSPDDAFDIFNKLKQKRFNLYSQPNITNAQHLSTTDLKRYWGGTWFEEYVYYRIKRDYHLKDEAIASSAKIYRRNSLLNDNEIDVLFVQNNALYVIECKVSMYGYGYSTAQRTIEHFLYKLAAISKDLGLHVNAYLFTLHPMQRLSADTHANLEKRRSILGIRGIYDAVSISNPNLKL
jgi:hypothetical protein